MKFFSATLVYFVATAVGLTRADDHDHEHEHAHSCACEAEEFGFEIDCTNEQAMLDAEAFLLDTANGCLDSCEPESECHINFLVLRLHHDYCVHEEIPESVEESLHQFETNCEGCSISKKRDPSLPDCPLAACDDSGNAAHDALVAADCVTDCSSDACQSNFRVLRSEHDSCAEEVLTNTAETGLHIHEDVCFVHECNAIPVDENGQPMDTAADPLVCVPEEEEEETPPAGAVCFIGATKVLLLVLAMAATALLG